MKIRMNNSKLVMAMITFLAVIILPVSSIASHSWGGYHWARRSNPFTLKVGRNITSNWTTAFNTAVSDWNAASVMNLSAVTGGTTASRCAMVAGTIQVCNSTYGSTGWLGLASINLASGTTHITQGTAKMNDTYFNTSTYNNPNEKLHVMCQEIGHTFGLDHTSTNGTSQNTCMDYFSNTGANAGSTASTHPNSHDYSELSSIYSHLDTTTTIGFTSMSSAFSIEDDSDTTENPNSWGQLMRQSENGRSSTYEKQNRDGSTTVTHIFWTKEAADACPSAGCDHRYQYMN